MDIMNTKGFELDFKNNVLKINGEEIVIQRKTEETTRVVLAEDTAVPERSEMILDAHLDGNPCVGNIMVFEPRSHDSEIARGIAKTVPVRIINLNHHPVNLRKGIVLGYCSSVYSVIRKLETRGNSVGKITDELSNLLSSSSRSLRSDQTTKLRSLITKYANIFDNGQGGKGRTNSEKVLKYQENDLNLKPIVNWKKEDRKLTWEEVLLYSPTVNDGLFKRVLEKSDGTEERKQLIVPKNRVPEILEEIHNRSTGGHLGVTKMLGKVRERFYWVNCTTDVKEWCKKCVVCAASNGPQRHPKTPMRQYKSDGMVERMNRTINRYLSKVVSDHQRDWDQFLHLFLLAYRSSVHEATGQTPASIVMGRELRLPCDLKFGCTPGEDHFMSTFASNYLSGGGDSDRMKETYDINTNDGRYQPGNQVWLYNPQRRRGLSPKLKTPFAGSNDEQAEARVRHVSPPDSKLSFEEFMLLHFHGQKARYGQQISECPEGLHLPSRRRLDSWMSSSNHGGPAREREVRLLFGDQAAFAPQTNLSKCVGHIEECALVPEYKQFGDTEDSQRSRWPGLEGDKKYAGSPFPVYWNRNPGMLLQPQEVAKRENCRLFLLPDVSMQEWATLQILSWTRGWWYNSGRNVFKEGTVWRKHQ
ncbi:hypothetical protein NQ318_016803 [Aromia moschata]|uniref:RNA-directed DNA polymerase n=1 Tax=Aromia moschata TaxID=1265417 RepID=A0AAV8XCD6_9CUCU|nr:hypothetical protein NQ318_016803 [Aromia moschata]